MNKLHITACVLLALSTGACADQSTISWAKGGAMNGASFDAAGAQCGDRWLLDKITYAGPKAVADRNGKCPGDVGYGDAADYNHSISASNGSKPVWFRGF